MISRQGLRLWSYFFIFLAFVLIINLPGVRDLFFIRTLSRGMQAAIFPFQALLQKGQEAGSAVGSIVDLRNAQKENRELKLQVQELKARLSNFQELAAENDRLLRALHFSQSNYRFNLLPARLLSRSPTIFAKTVIINQGTGQGVQLDQPVINADGLVGKVIDVTPVTAKVQLITDLGSQIGVVLGKSREFGVISGGLGNTLELKYLDVNAPVTKDDVVVTSGASPIFPAGIMVGKVSQIDKGDNALFLKVKVESAVNFSKLDEVFVIR